MIGLFITIIYQVCRHFVQLGRPASRTRAKRFLLSLDAVVCGIFDNGMYFFLRRAECEDYSESGGEMDGGDGDFLVGGG